MFVVSIDLIIMTIPDLVGTSTYSLIFSEIDLDDLCLVNYAKGWKGFYFEQCVFPGTPPLVSSFYRICFIFIYLVSLCLAALHRHSSRWLYLTLMIFYFLISSTHFLFFNLYFFLQSFWKRCGNPALFPSSSSAGSVDVITHLVSYDSYTDNHYFHYDNDYSRVWYRSHMYLLSYTLCWPHAYLSHPV